MKRGRVTAHTSERHEIGQRRLPPASTIYNDEVSSMSTSRDTHGRDERVDKSKGKRKLHALASSSKSLSQLSSGRHKTTDKLDEMAVSSPSSRSADCEFVSSSHSTLSAGEQRRKVQRRHEVQASRSTVRHVLSELDSFVPPQQPLPVQEVVYVRYGVARPVTSTAGHRRPPRRVL